MKNFLCMLWLLRRLFLSVRKIVRPIRTRTVYNESFSFEISLGKKNSLKYGSFFSGLKAFQAFFLLISRHIYTYISPFIQGNLINFLLCFREIHVWSEDTVSLRRHLTLTTGVNSAIYRLTRGVGLDEWVSCLLNYSLEMPFSSLWLALTLRVYTWSVNNGFYLARKYAEMFVRGLYLFQGANSFPRAKLKETCELRE